MGACPVRRHALDPAGQPRVADGHRAHVRVRRVVRGGAHEGAVHRIELGQGEARALLLLRQGGLDVGAGVGEPALDEPYNYGPVEIEETKAVGGLAVGEGQSEMFRRRDVTAPLLPAEAGAPPSRRQANLVLVLMAGFVALACLFGGIGASRIGSGSDLGRILGGDETTAVATSEDTGGSGSSSGGGEPLAIANAAGYDPAPGDGVEHNAEAPRVYDGNPDTTWTTEGYGSEAFGRVKQGGGHSGHNGLRSIHQHLGEAYGRVRIGIGHPGHKDRVAGYVLSDFAKAEEGMVEDLLRGISDGAEALARGDGAAFGTALAARVAPPRAKPVARPAAPAAEPEPAPPLDPLEALRRRFA